MSGFVAVFNLDSAPVDRALLDDLTRALEFRGPDGRDIWTGDVVGLGHTRLDTVRDGLASNQPCTLDGATWIAGDIRIDRQKELFAQLALNHSEKALQVSDAHLVLHAYDRWGEHLLDHIIGDFSFVLWDDRRQRLFAARDHMGVKPLFHARAGTQLVVSNTLACLRAHRAIGDDLNDAAIGDFLLFGFNADPATTTFRSIRRVPPGHALTCGRGEEVRIAPYWQLPTYETLRLPSSGDYVERFNQILDEAISDRLRTDRVAIHMSGGLDSSLLSARAHRLMNERYATPSLSALTVVYDEHFRDEERHYSTMVADHLSIPIHHLAADSFALFEGADPCDPAFPEPLEGLARPAFHSAFNHASEAQARVVLSGYDGDALLSGSWQRELGAKLRSGRFVRAAADLVRFAAAKRGLWKALGRRARFRQGGGDADDGFPTWLQPAFERENHLRERWEAGGEPLPARPGARGRAYAAMQSPVWLPILECRDPGFTGVPVEHRHPLLDLRVVEFSLSLPVIPWCVDKFLFREAARPLLPRPVVRRPKSPLAGDPLPFAIRAYLARSSTMAEWHPAMARYIDPSRRKTLIDDLTGRGYWFALRVLMLDFWLSQVKDARK